MLNVLQTKGMTLEDISVLFGDPVELSFEQALHKEGTRGRRRPRTKRCRSTGRI